MSIDDISFKLGQIDEKLETIVATQLDISVNGCHLGQAHTRQIAKLQDKSGVKKAENSNWVEVTKNGIKAGGFPALILILLGWLTWNQSHQNSSAVISRDEIAQVVQIQMHQMARDNVKLLANGESTKQEFKKQTVARTELEGRIMDKVMEEKK
jgi:hypothetical protein